MSDSPRAVVQRYLDAYNSGDPSALDAVWDEAYVHHNNDAALTGAQFKRGAAWLRAAIPDFRIEVEEMIAEGDVVAARLTARGTHTGSLFGEAPTGREIALHLQMFCRVRDGRITEDWEVMDEQDLRTKVGAAAG